PRPQPGEGIEELGRMVTTAAAERFLAAPFLADVDPGARSAVLNVLAEANAPAGAVLMTQGQPNDHISFLIEGTVTVLRTYPQGRVETVVVLNAPSVFGETSFFGPNVPIVSVHADAPVWLLTLDHPAHDRLRRDDPRAAEQIALAFVRVLAERFDLLDKRVSDYLAQLPDGRSEEHKSEL